MKRALKKQETIVIKNLNDATISHVVRFALADEALQQRCDEVLCMHCSNCSWMAGRGALMGFCNRYARIVYHRNDTGTAHEDWCEVQHCDAYPADGGN